MQNTQEILLMGTDPCSEGTDPCKCKKITVIIPNIFMVFLLARARIKIWNITKATRILKA